MTNHCSAWWSLALYAALCGAAYADDQSYFEKQIEPYTKKPELLRRGRRWTLKPV